MNIIEKLQWRYAVKKFDKTKFLSNEQVELLKEAFNLTATSYGLQPVKLLVIQNKEIQKELVAHSWNQSQVLDASHLLVICVPKKYTTEEVSSYFNLAQKIRNTPDEIINPFKKFLTAEIEKKTQEELSSVRYWIDCGDDDFLTIGNAQLHIALTNKNVPHEFRMRDGAHNWTYWRTGIIDALSFIGDSFHQK